MTLPLVGPLLDNKILILILILCVDESLQYIYFQYEAVQEYGHVIINKYISSGTVYKSGVLYIYISLFSYSQIHWYRKITT